MASSTRFCKCFKFASSGFKFEDAKQLRYQRFRLHRKTSLFIAVLFVVKVLGNAVSKVFLNSKLSLECEFFFHFKNFIIFRVFSEGVLFLPKESIIHSHLFIPPATQRLQLFWMNIQRNKTSQRLLPRNYFHFTFKVLILTPEKISL